MQQVLKSTQGYNEVEELSQSSHKPQDNTYFVDCICGARGVNYKDNKELIKCTKCGVYFHKECQSYSYIILCHKCKEIEDKEISPTPPQLPPKPPQKPIYFEEEDDEDDYPLLPPKPPLKPVDIRNNQLKPKKKRKKTQDYDDNYEYNDEDDDAVYDKPDSDYDEKPQRKRRRSITSAPKSSTKQKQSKNQKKITTPKAQKKSSAFSNIMKNAKKHM